jgi:hypothetical protein
MTRLAKSSLAIVVALLIGALSTASVQADRNRARTSVNRSKSVNVDSSRRTNVDIDRNRDVNINRSRDINIDRDRDVDIDIDRDRDIDVDIDRYGCCYHSGWGTAAAITTALVVGSVVNTLPPNCTTVVINGFAYRQCGSTWYQPQFSGSRTTYVVVNSPR